MHPQRERLIYKYGEEKYSKYSNHRKTNTISERSEWQRKGREKERETHSDRKVGYSTS
jgi:hypothetical protein